MRILRDAKLFTRDKIGLPALLMFISACLFAVQAMAIEIPLEKQGGVYTLQVRINGVFTLPFVLDTGASEVTIPADVALSLLRTGTISEKDFLPDKKFTLADGSIVTGSRFNIKELEAGGFRISDVPAVVVSIDGSLLLGQSFLSRAPHWAIDNEKHLLIISDLKRAESSSTQKQPGIGWLELPDQPTGIAGLKWGDSPAEAKHIMVKLNAVDEDDVCEGNDKEVSKEARKHWECYLPWLSKELCQSHNKLNDDVRKCGHYLMNFHGTFIDGDGTAYLTFYEGKLFEVSINFDDTSDSLYRDLMRLLKTRYGPGETKDKGTYKVTWWWAAQGVSDINLTHHICEKAPCLPTEVEFSDLKIWHVANERYQRYYREKAAHDGKSSPEAAQTPEVDNKIAYEIVPITPEERKRFTYFPGTEPKEEKEEPASKSTHASKSVIAPIPDPPGKYTMLVKAMLDGAKNAEVEKIDRSKAELQGLSKDREKCRSDEAHKKNAAGIEATSKEDYNDAVKHFYDAYLYCPNNPEFLNNLALALTKTGDYDNAEKALFTAVALAPTRTNAWALLGQVLAIKGDVTGGCACFLNAFRYTRSEKTTTKALQHLADNDPFPSTQEAARLALSKLGKGPPPPKPIVTITDSVQAYYLENMQSGQVLVIEGEVLNESSKPVSFVMIEGKLFDSKDAVAQTQRCYVGNSFTRKEIANLNLSEIREKMMNREGINLKNVQIPPTGKMPFMLVFHNLPDLSSLSNYSVNVVSSKLVEGLSYSPDR